MTHVED